VRRGIWKLFNVVDGRQTRKDILLDDPNVNDLIVWSNL